MYSIDELRTVDPEIADAIEAEQKRQAEHHRPEATEQHLHHQEAEQQKPENVASEDRRARREDTQQRIPLRTSFTRGQKGLRQEKK